MNLMQTKRFDKHNLPNLILLRNIALTATSIYQEMEEYQEFPVGYSLTQPELIQ